MIMESIWLETIRERGAEGWRRSAWWGVAAGALLLLALALAWSGTRSSTSAAQHVAIIGELQVGARDVSALSLLALSGDAAALVQLRDRTANVDSTLAALINGGKHKGDAVSPPPDWLQTRLNEFATRWAEFKHRTDALFVAKASAEAQAATDPKARRLPEKRLSSGPAQKATPTRGGSGSEVGVVAISLLSDGHALATAMDGIRTELDGRQARPPWLLYLALVCGLAAASVLAALVISVWRSGLALQQTATQSNAALFEVLRPALKTLHIEADATSLADPVMLGRRLSAEILVVIDGVKTLVKALAAATAEADKFAVVGHIAAQALAVAAQKAEDTGASLQATARRIAAVYAALSAGAAEAQQHCAQSLEIVATGLTTAKDSVRLADQVRDGMNGATKRYSEIVAINPEIAQALLEVTDLLTQAEGLALRAGNRLASAGASEAAAFANDVRSYLGPSVAMLKRSMELVQRVERESGELSNELAQAAAHATDQARRAGDASRAPANAESAVRELSGKIASLARLASGAETSQLLSALDEIVRQIAQSSASARQVLAASKNAADHIEALAKILNDLKPS